MPSTPWPEAFAAAFRLLMVTDEVDWPDLLDWARELQALHGGEPAAEVASAVWASVNDLPPVLH